jgi:hypothetical protein
MDIEELLKAKCGGAINLGEEFTHLISRPETASWGNTSVEFVKNCEIHQDSAWQAVVNLAISAPRPHLGQT